MLNVIKEFFSNPYLFSITVFNAINLIPDPTTDGIGDSQQPLTYARPRKDDK
nr:phage holin [Alkalibacterium putridalgicola]